MPFNVRDDFRRDGLAASFLVSKQTFQFYLKAFPSNTRFNIGYPSICKQEYITCQDILSIDPSKKCIELCVVGHARPYDLQLMANILHGKSNVSANIWIPASEDACESILNMGAEEAFQLAEKSIFNWKKYSNHPLDIALTDVTNDESSIANRVVRWYHDLKALGYRSIILCDTKGRGDNGTLLEIFNNIDEFEWHPHNDQGAALYTSQLAVDNGATHIGTSYFCFSERGNMLDPRTLIQGKLNASYLEEFNKSFEDQVGGSLEEVRDSVYGEGISITGTHHKLWNGQHNKKLVFGVTSNCEIVYQMTGVYLSPIQLAWLKDRELYTKKVLFIDQKELKHILLDGLEKLEDEVLPYMEQPIDDSL